VWVGLLCLGAQFSAALHGLLVEHRQCAEHGEWVHVDREHAGGHVSARGEPAPDGPVFNAPAAEDDHCLVGSELRKATLFVPSVPELRAPNYDGDAEAMGRRCPAHSALIYSFAPKTSPPA
jgi:hypothetical protein